MPGLPSFSETDQAKGVINACKTAGVKFLVWRYDLDYTLLFTHMYRSFPPCSSLPSVFKASGGKVSVALADGKCPFFSVRAF